MLRVDWQPSKPIAPLATATHHLSENDAVNVNVLTAVTYAYDVLCILYDIHHMSCARDPIRVVEVEQHQLPLVSAFDAGVL